MPTPARIAAVAADVAGRPPLQQVAILRDFHLADGEDHYRRLRTLLPGHDVVVAAWHSRARARRGPRCRAGVRHGGVRPGPAADAQRASAGPAAARSAEPAGVVDARSDPRARRTPASTRSWRAPGARSAACRCSALARRGSIFSACSPAIIRVPPDLPAGTLVTGAWLDDRPVSPLPSELEAFLGRWRRRRSSSASARWPARRTAAMDGAVRAILESGRRVVVQGSIAAGVDSPGLIRIGAVDHRALFPRAAARRASRRLRNDPRRRRGRRAVARDPARRRPAATGPIGCVGSESRRSRRPYAVCRPSAWPRRRVASAADPADAPACSRPGEAGSQRSGVSTRPSARSRGSGG